REMRGQCIDSALSGLLRLFSGSPDIAPNGVAGPAQDFLGGLALHDKQPPLGIPQDPRAWIRRDHDVPASHRVPIVARLVDRDAAHSQQDFQVLKVACVHPSQKGGDWYVWGQRRFFAFSTAPQMRSDARPMAPRPSHITRVPISALTSFSPP